MADVFYCYDIMVQKVFFTGAITAMLGLLFFSLFGWVDLNLIYVNPTYLTSAIVGGVIMGAGFIMGGYCPGTSFCGASIGKIDAMIFIVGLFIGVAVFGAGYDWWDNMYMAKFLGSPKISESLGLTDGVFAIVLIVIALGMFFVAEWAEKKFARKEY